MPDILRDRAGVAAGAGLLVLIAAVLIATGEELGRAAFMNAIESGEPFETDIYSPVVLTPDDHFGGTGAHLLDADCAAKMYTTTAQFVEGGVTEGAGSEGGGSGGDPEGTSEGAEPEGAEPEGGEPEGGEPEEGGEAEGAGSEGAEADG